MDIDKNDRHDKRRATEGVVNSRIDCVSEKEIKTGKWREREIDWERQRERLGNKQKEW